jgi:hypothetical protein
MFGVRGCTCLRINCHPVKQYIIIGIKLNGPISCLLPLLAIFKKKKRTDGHKESTRKVQGKAGLGSFLQADSGINRGYLRTNYWIDWGKSKGTTVERMERRVDRRPGGKHIFEFSVAGPPRNLRFPRFIS